MPPALPGGKLPVTKRTVDASKVSDHHALIPTAKRVDPASFPEDERRLYDLVARRMLAAFYPACEYDATRVVTQVDEDTFRTNGRIVVQNGWRDVQPLSEAPKTRKKAKSAEEAEETALPPLHPGDTRIVRGAAVKEEPPSLPSSTTTRRCWRRWKTRGGRATTRKFARQMKGSGIGTPATRAAIIERLIKVGYAQRKGKTILATDKGVQLIAIMPAEIASPEMTGRWELALDRITDGSQDAERFMESIRRFSTFLVTYAQGSSAAVTFPDDGRRKARQKRHVQPRQGG